MHEPYPKHRATIGKVTKRPHHILRMTSDQDDDATEDSVTNNPVLLYAFQ